MQPVIDGMEIVLEKLAKHQISLNEWCECGGKLENSIYFPDNFFTAFKTHHYRCNNCGCILQVGKTNLVGCQIPCQVIISRRGKNAERAFMNNLNSILLEGNLISQTRVNEKTVEFTMASARWYKKDDEIEKEVSFFKVRCFNSLAEKIVQLKKGRGVRVIGRLKQERFHDENGKAFTEILIIAEHIEFKPEFKPADIQKVSF